jgi:two-component system CheB/CheR fusion protein
VLANKQARSLFGLTVSDLGRPMHDLELSFRPADLRSAFAAVQEERRPVSLGIVAWQSAGGDDQFHEIVATPLTSAGGDFLGSSITFTDVTRYEGLRTELERSKRELEMAYEELQSTVEELETTNEELQSTNEELETTNEELQSTNEELETMNEELQSTNEELETINEELRERSTELDRVNAFLESILISLAMAVAVLDRDQRIQVWNDRAEDLWGLRSDEVVGQHLLSLDIGLPVEKLRRPLQRALSGDVNGNEHVLQATNRRGREIACKVACLPLLVPPGEVKGVIVLMEEVERASQRA